ncbi:MAG: tetratricopeptide repeat protein [Phycisphaerae bacterium]|nr:tetratricopeptide repeat protein [Phycisphaerae bacterium]
MTCLLPDTSRRRHHLWLLAGIVLAFGGVRAASAASDTDAARAQLRTGQYEKSLEAAQKAIKDGAYSIQWRLLEVESLMALGRYKEAVQRIDSAIRDSRTDIRLLALAYTVYQQNGQASQAGQMLTMIYRIAGYRRSQYLNGDEVVALGRSLLTLGVEPRVVLENFYNVALRSDPNCREAYLAIGSLAMAKQDDKLAADKYQEALKRFGDDPDVHYGLAQAFYQSDRKAMIAALDAALHVNPRHVPALVLLAEHQIDCEDRDAAAKTLDRALAVNPWHPDAWAYRAVLAHLANDPNAVASRRANALKFWPSNPRVDCLIGRKLSQNYRFAEGAACQRQSLKFDPNYLAARIQLAEDLLRLGDEQQGWILANEVNKKDPYNVEAYNLVHLHDAISAFQTLSADGLLVKMDKREAAVYGDKVVELLKQARSKLCEKYGFEPNGPVTVELFPNQQDFAVRTFGMPAVEGFLGVCFGKVITANSPRAATAFNWQSMLWHEFCHVVTLSLTANKMPRWLSEGISVYEESQHDPTWGQQMNPTYRRMILGGELTPVGNLSAAFLSPKTPMHLQFAYYESALVVEFLVQRSGLASLKAILADLAKGEPINAAIAKRAGPLDKIETEFEVFARKRAETLAPGVDWEQPPREQLGRGEGVPPSERGQDARDTQSVTQWLDKHPNSFWALTAQADRLLADRQWEQAKAPLQKLISLYPKYADKDNAYQLLAAVHRNLNETAQEAEVLGTLAGLSSDAADAYSRLMEIGTEQKNWTQVVENGVRYLAVYPMLSATYWRLGRANEELGRAEPAVQAYQRLLLLDPSDPVEVNYRLARLLQQRDPAAAKRHILEALADAPRFREGHQLLLTMPAQGESK